MIDIVKSQNAKAQNRRIIESYREKVRKFDADADKEIRLTEGLCKFCMYVLDRIGGSAMTTRNCDNCGKEMLFGSTCTDALCLKCAVETQHCAHCLQKID